MSMPGKPVPLEPKRVVAYIDGFNLYYGLKTSDMRRFLWLDLPCLAKSLIREDQSRRGLLPACRNPWCGDVGYGLASQIP